MAKTEWASLRWIQANVKYTEEPSKFLEALAKLDHYHPDVITLNEVGGRVSLLNIWAQANNYFQLQPERQHGMADDQAILLRITSWKFDKWGVERMHKEPPGAPTARFMLWAGATFKPARQPLLLETYHSLAAVERGNKLNPIARTRYYVQGNLNVVRYTIQNRKMIAARNRLSTVPVILAGDLNWSWTPESWINKTMGAYFLCSHVALKRVATLGKRSVDIVAKRGGRVKFVRQFSIFIPSDHRGLVVDMQVRVR